MNSTILQSAKNVVANCSRGISQNVHLIVTQMMMKYAAKWQASSQLFMESENNPFSAYLPK